MPGTDPSTFSDFTALKSRNPSFVAGISIGGWSFNNNNAATQPVFGDIVSSPANRQTFISNLMSFMTHYGFDAVDIDWEYPGAPDRQPNQANSQADGGNYMLLLQEMRKKRSTPSRIIGRYPSRHLPHIGMQLFAVPFSLISLP
jgi:chitinase